MRTAASSLQETPHCYGYPDKKDPVCDECELIDYCLIDSKVKGEAAPLETDVRDAGDVMSREIPIPRENK